MGNQDRSTRASLTVGAKLTLATVCVVAAFTSLIYVALTRFQRENILRSKEDAAAMVVGLLSEAVAAPVLFDDATGVRDTLAYLRGNQDVLSADVWRLRGTDIERVGSYSRTEAEALAPIDTSLARGVLRASDDLIVVTQPVRDPQGTELATVTVRFSLARENVAFEQLSVRILATAFAIALVLTLVLVVVSRRWIVRPLGALIEFARGLEEGKRGAAAPLSSGDEIGKLGEALGRMAGAIATREEAIARRNADMRRVLDNVGEGFLLLDKDGVIGTERSAVVDRWFGAIDPGSTLASVLGRAQATLGKSFQMGWEALIDEFLPRELCVAQLPSRASLEGRHFEFRYRLVETDGVLESVIVVITDATSEIERARADAQQRDFVQAVTRLVANRAAFVKFLREADDLVSRITTSGGDRVAVVRNIHTLKGICALQCIGQVAETCHAVESRVLETNAEIAHADVEQIASVWRSFAASLRPVLDIDQAERLEIDAADMSELSDALIARAPHARILALVESWKGERVSSRLRELGEQAEALALKLGRASVDIEVEAGRLRAPNSAWADLWSSLIHLVRNAVDHGIEPMSERVSANKAPRARLALRARRNREVMTLSISDDGRGIDWDAIEARAVALGLKHETPAELVDAMFADGLSTRTDVTEVSGRGVGLSAIRAAVVALGGTISVQSERGRGTTFELTLPSSTAHEHSEAA
jgi:HAMP domain-containing protein/HPt (histidine-containing phosphotransfer) domain-containing protein